MRLLMDAASFLTEEGTPKLYCCGHLKFLAFSLVCFSKDLVGVHTLSRDMAAVE